MDSHPYILGTGDEELDRLAHQNEVWRDTTHALWDHGGFSDGQHVVDLACGPGFTTFELAQRVGSSGSVTAIDNSQRFLAQVDAWSRERGLGNISTRLADATAPGLKPGSADGIFIRWLLCFLPDARAVIEQASKALAPGGSLVVMDYFNYLAIRLFPDSEIFRHVFGKVYESFGDAGGNLDVASDLPGLMHGAGLEVTHIRPICAAAPPGSPVWQWVRGFQKNYLPQLVDKGYLRPEELRDFEDDWKQHELTPGSFFFAPPMLGVVGKKPGSGAPP